MPSRFIDELPADHVDVRSPSGLYGGAKSKSRRGFSERGGQFRGGFAERGFTEGDDAGNDAAAHEVGGRVFHQKFGYGRITAIDGGKLDIDFDKAGRKKVMASFVETA